MASTKANREKFITSSIYLARDNDFDGIDIDWEYPGFAEQGGKPEDKANFILLLKEMRGAIDSERLTGSRKKLLLTIAVGIGFDKIEVGYDIPNIYQYVEYIALMSYDLHGSWDKKTYSHTPIYAIEGVDEDSIDYKYTISYGLNLWVKGGTPRNKLVMGLALYGRCWSLESSAPGQGILSNAKGNATEGEWTRTAGFLAYFEISRMAQSGGVVSYDSRSRSSYIQKGNQWCSYDEKQNLMEKVNYAMSEGLSGIMFWAVDQDEYITDNHPLVNYVVKESKCGVSICGDGKCSSDENCQSCPIDCGRCGEYCGDGNCASNEDCYSCPEDCGTCKFIFIT